MVARVQEQRGACRGRQRAVSGNSRLGRSGAPMSEGVDQVEGRGDNVHRTPIKMSISLLRENDN